MPFLMITPLEQPNEGAELLDIRNCWAMRPQPRPWIGLTSGERVRRQPDRVTLTPAMRIDLTRYRNNARLSQEELALGTGFSQSWISQLELGSVQTVRRQDYDTLLDYCVKTMQEGVAA
jgi:DNA-binding XRE family transcriptional regulator